MPNLVKGKDQFTQEEKAKIEKLLAEKCTSERDKQKVIRDKLRKIKFYITDFYNKNDGYNVEKFQKDIKNGKIKILN